MIKKSSLVEWNIIVNKGRMPMYEGKTKRVTLASNQDEVIIYYKDDSTAFNGVKRSNIKNKGVMNNRISAIIFEMLEIKGIPTHFIKQISDREQLCKKVEMIPLEVKVRNSLAGRTARRLGIAEGTVAGNIIYELCYKSDAMGDPLINEDYAAFLGLATYEESAQIKKVALKINEELTNYFAARGIRLIDLKMEFGRDLTGNIILADEISPDTCRLWDQGTGEKLDKDRFRRNLGNVTKGYEEILNRLQIKF